MSKYIHHEKRLGNNKRKTQNPHNQEDEDFKPAAKKRNVTTPTRVYSKDRSAKK